MKSGTDSVMTPFESSTNLQNKKIIELVCELQHRSNQKKKKDHLILNAPQQVQNSVTFLTQNNLKLKQQKTESKLKLD